MKVNLKEVLQMICVHGLILLRGFAKVLYGTVTAALVGLAVYGLTTIPSEGGYAAVSDFLCAAVCIVMALALMYSFGCKRSRR